MKLNAILGGFLTYHEKFSLSSMTNHGPLNLFYLCAVLETQSSVESAFCLERIFSNWWTAVLSVTQENDVI